MRRFAWFLCLLYAVPMFAAPTDVEARRQQLNALISELWEWTLQQEPVYASILGDKRYNDQMGSRSEKTILDQQAREKEFLKRFEAIDATGLPHQDVLNRAVGDPFPQRKHRGDGFEALADARKPDGWYPY